MVSRSKYFSVRRQRRIAARDERARAPGFAACGSNGAFRLGEMSEPQPDLLLLKSRPDFYRSEFAKGDSLLAVEVSATTLCFDRDVKAPLYARYGVPEYWSALARGAQ